MQIKKNNSVEKLKTYKSPGTDPIPAGLIQTGGEIVGSEIHEPSNCVRSMEELPQKWKEFIILPIYKNE
jgi:hypothetical protein